MSQPSAEDFDAVHAGVMETTRGRWFLHEYSRRYRNADTTLLLTAIKRMESALNIQNAIPASSHEPVRLTDQSAPLRRNFEAVPFAHQLYELRDAVRLTKDSLPLAGSGHNAQANPDFTRVAKAISVIAARMRWIAEQVPEAQKRAIATVHDDLDKLVEAASMIAALLEEVETQLDSLIDTAQALAEAEVLAATEPASLGPAAAEPVSAAAPPATPEPVQDAPVEATATDITALELAQTAAAAEAIEITSPAPDLIAESLTPHAAEIERLAEISVETFVVATAEFAVETAPAPQDTRWLQTLAPQIVGPATQDALIDAPVNFELAVDPPPVIALPNPAQREGEQAPAKPQPAPPKTPEIVGFELVQRLIEDTVVEKIAETIKETIQQTITATLPEKAAAPAPAAHITAPSPRDEPREDPAAFVFDPFSHGLQWEPQFVLPAAPVQSIEVAQPMQPIAAEQPAPVAQEPKQEQPKQEQPKEAPRPTNGATKPVSTPILKAKPSSVLAPIMALSDEEKIALFS